MNDLFKKRLNEIITENNVTQSKIVKYTNINKGALSCYLKGLYNPKRENIVKLASFFNVNPDWLEGQDVPKYLEYSYVNYDNLDSITKYFDFVFSVKSDDLNDNIINTIGNILKDNNIINDISEFTRLSKQDIISFIEEKRNILIDKKILIDITDK